MKTMQSYSVVIRFRAYFVLMLLEKVARIDIVSGIRRIRAPSVCKACLSRSRSERELFVRLL